MSTYLSATQISCPGSLRGEERVTHKLATVPRDGHRSPCTGTSTIHLGGPAEFSSHLGNA